MISNPDKDDECNCCNETAGGAKSAKKENSPLLRAETPSGLPSCYVKGLGKFNRQKISCSKPKNAFTWTDYFVKNKCPDKLTKDSQEYNWFCPLQYKDSRTYDDTDNSKDCQVYLRKIPYVCARPHLLVSRNQVEKIDQMDGTKFANLDFVRTHISGQGLVRAFYLDFNGFFK